MSTMIISFDCGTNNLGVCVMIFDKAKLLRLREQLAEILLMVRSNSMSDAIKDNKTSITETYCDELLSAINAANKTAEEFFQLRHIDLVTAKTAANLKTYLTRLDQNIVTPFAGPKTVLIEKQFVPGSSSCIVSHYIQYHYANYETFASYNTSWQPFLRREYDVQMVGASLKNLRDFDKSLPFSHFQEKYKTNYTANKEHSVAQFNYILKHFNQTTALGEAAAVRSNGANLVGSANVVGRFRGKKMRDIADAYMMAVAWVLKRLTQCAVHATAQSFM